MNTQSQLNGQTENHSIKGTSVNKMVHLSTLASLVGSDRIRGLDNYKLINKYVGPLPQMVEIKGGK